MSENNAMRPEKTKFCKFCGGKIPENAVICTLCGRQVEELKHSQASAPNVVINNANNNVNTNINAGMYRKQKNKWAAFFLCFFFGYLGVHKFYEGKIGMGILYLCTLGIVGIGWVIDLIALLFKPNPYYV